MSDLAFNLILFNLTSFSKAFNLTVALTLASSCNTISVKPYQWYSTVCQLVNRNLTIPGIRFKEVLSAIAMMNIPIHN